MGASRLRLLVGAALVCLCASIGYPPLPPPLFQHPVEDAIRLSRGDAGRPVVINGLPPKEVERLTRVSLPRHPNAAPNSDPYTYSGYVQVSTTPVSSMFYWFFPPQNGNPDAPILLWLQGGPGGSSMFGLFAENGPYTITQDLKMVPRNITWNSEFGMLYIDNPVGVGFSFTEDPSGYSTTETEVGANLYTALQGFFTSYPQWQKNDFYVTGESYGGKYVPALGYTIWQENQKNPPLPINLKGLAIGDGWCDPVTMATQYAPLMEAFGLADPEQRQTAANLTGAIINNIEAKNWAAASKAFQALVDGPPDFFTDITGSYNYYDIRKSSVPGYGGPFAQYLNQTSIREKLHVGNHYFGVQSGDAAAALNDDIPKSIKPLFPTLLDNYKVLFYNGQFDFIVAAQLTEYFIPTIPWSGIKGFTDSGRTIWKLEDDPENVAGYVRQYKTLSQIVVRDAGHILPADQPARAFDMVHRWVNDLPFTNPKEDSTSTQ